jgi:hypothetical protein
MKSAVRTIFAATLFLALALAQSAPATAQGDQQAAYQGCLDNCVDKFANVLDSEKSCEETIKKVHHDLSFMNHLLQRSDLCVGRNKGACKDFLEYARPAVEKVLAHTLDVSNCMEADAKALQDELWLFDTATACKGDGTFTDLHDFLVAKKAYIEDFNNNSPNYAMDRRMFDAYDDFHGHRPDCLSGARPSLSHVYPLFEFYLALDSLLAYQACLPSCRAPTVAEKRIWAMEEILAKTRSQTDSLAIALQAKKAARQRALMDELGISFPCRPYSKSLVEVKANREVLTKLESALREFQLAPAENEGKLNQFQREVNQLGASVKASEILEIEEACVAEDALAKQLLERKRKVVDKVLRGETFCFEAARVFSQVGELGSACDWLGDCNMPLLCKKGSCTGKVSVSEVRSLLDRVKALADQGLQMKVHDEQGLVKAAQRKIHDLEKDVAEAELELQDHDWQEAVATWRSAYREDVPAQLAELSQRIEEVGATDAQDEEDVSRACKRAYRKVGVLAENLTGLQDALGDPDPVLRAKWVRLKSRDAASLQEELVELKGDIEAACEGPEEGGSNTVIYAVGGGILLLLLGLVGFFIIRRRK